MAFELKKHMIGSISIKVMPKIKKYTEGLLNLKSNQLMHPGIGRLYQEFCREFPVEKIKEYPYYPGTAGRLARHLGISGERLLLTAGSDDAIKIVMASLLSTTRRMILQYPNYENFITYANLNRVNNTVIDCYFDIDKFKEQFIQALQSSPPSTAVIANPHGWTGYCFSLEEMRYFAGLCRENNHIFLIDEAYFPYNGFHHLDIANEFENVIILRSYSKSFGLAGLRIGAVIGDKDMIHYISRWQPTNPVSVIALDFLSFCLDHMPAIQQIQSEIIENRQFFREWLKENFPCWIIHESQANFILIDTRSQEMQAKIVSFLLERKVYTRDFSNEPQLETCFRIVVPDRETLNNRIIKLFEEFKALTYQGDRQ